jgi:tetratricopeptide (TPR) repeat protein
MAGGTLLMLSADKGGLDEETVLSRGPPRVTVHGSISLRVNYHALGEWTRAQGGALLAAPHRHTHIAVVGLALGAGELPETRRAFAAGVERFGPDEYYTLKGALEPRFEDLSPEQALALVRLSRFDPRVFAQCLPVLQKSAATLPAGMARDLLRVSEEVGASYYHIGESQDFPFKLGLLLFTLKQYRPAMAWFERSLALYGGHAMTYYNLAVSCYRLGEDVAARRWVAQALGLEPTHPKALALRDALGEEEPPAKA